MKQGAKKLETICSQKLQTRLDLQNKYLDALHYIYGLIKDQKRSKDLCVVIFRLQILSSSDKTMALQGGKMKLNLCAKSK